MSRKKSLEDEQLTDANYFILLALTTPIHGYGIMQRIKEISSERIEIGPASLYTSLKKLQEAELIKLIDIQDKKVYRITEKGNSLLWKDYMRRKEIVAFSKAVLEEEHHEG